MRDGEAILGAAIIGSRQLAWGLLHCKQKRYVGGKYGMVKPWDETMKQLIDASP